MPHHRTPLRALGPLLLLAGASGACTAPAAPAPGAKLPESAPTAEGEYAMIGILDVPPPPSGPPAKRARAAFTACRSSGAKYAISDEDTRACEAWLTASP